MAARSSSCSSWTTRRRSIDRAVGLGARQVYAAESQHGWLLGRVEDPFGHHWEIGRPLVEWPPTARHA